MVSWRMYIIIIYYIHIGISNKKKTEMLTIHIKCITFEVLDVMSMYYVLREMISGDYCIEVRILSRYRRSKKKVVEHGGSDGSLYSVKPHRADCGLSSSAC